MLFSPMLFIVIRPEKTLFDGNAIGAMHSKLSHLLSYFSCFILKSPATPDWASPC